MSTSRPTSLAVTSDLEPIILSMGTCKILRIKQIGQVFLIENMQARHPETGEETWRAVAKSPTSKDAHQWLHEANKEVLATWRGDAERRNKEIWLTRKHFPK